MSTITVLLFILVVNFSQGFPCRMKRTSFKQFHLKSDMIGINNKQRYQWDYLVKSSKASCSTTLCVFPDASLVDSSTILLNVGLDGLLSNENIKKAFSLGTFGPQLLWLLMILQPKAELTKKIMGGYTGVLFFCILHLFVVVASASQQDGTAPLVEFQGVFDASPEADPQAAMLGMMRYPNFVTEEWTHVLTWDLFVGRWIWLDGLKRNIFTAHSVLLCNLIGPPGLLLHYLTCFVSSEGFPASDTDNEML